MDITCHGLLPHPGLKLVERSDLQAVDLFDGLDCMSLQYLSEEVEDGPLLA